MPGIFSPAFLGGLRNRVNVQGDEKISPSSSDQQFQAQERSKMVAIYSDTLELLPRAYATAVRILREAGTVVVTVAGSVAIGFITVTVIPVFVHLAGFLLMVLLGAPAWALLALFLHG